MHRRSSPARPIAASARKSAPLAAWRKMRALSGSGSTGRSQASSTVPRWHYRPWPFEHRPTSASGGVATWLLETLLSNDIVDHVICVAPTGDPERLFEFKVFSTPNEVRTGAGSAYYPIEMSAAIREVLETPGRYAIVGLPCFIKAVRLQRSSAKQRERIVVSSAHLRAAKDRHFTTTSPLAGVRGTVMA